MTTARFPENMMAACTRGERPRWRVKAWRRPNEDSPSPIVAELRRSKMDALSELACQHFFPFRRRPIHWIPYGPAATRRTA